MKFGYALTLIASQALLASALLDVASETACHNAGGKWARMWLVDTGSNGMTLELTNTDTGAVVRSFSSLVTNTFLVGSVVVVVVVVVDDDDVVVEGGGGAQSCCLGRTVTSVIWNSKGNSTGEEAVLGWAQAETASWAGVELMSCCCCAVLPTGTAGRMRTIVSAVGGVVGWVVG